MGEQPGGSGFARWLVGPSQRIVDEEQRKGARLLAGLAPIHLAATVVATVAATALGWRMLARLPPLGPLGWFLLSGPKCPRAVTFRYAQRRVTRSRMSCRRPWKKWSAPGITATCRPNGSA